MKRKLFAILMALTLVLTYMPALAFAEAEPGASTWKADNVKSIVFKPVGDKDRFTFYKGIDDADDDFYVGFELGDQIIATLENGSTRTLIFTEGYETGYWLIKEENKKLTSYIEPAFDYEYSESEDGGRVPWTIDGDNKFRVCFGSHTVTSEDGDVFTKTVFSGWMNAIVKESPVTNISFALSEDSSEDRLTYYVGDDDYDFWIEDGDKLTVTIDGVTKTYTYENREGDNSGFFCGEECLPEKYGEYNYWFEVDGEKTYSVPYEMAAETEITVKVSYGKQECVAAVIKVEANPIESISYIPAVTEYSEAKILLSEEVEYDDEGEDTGEDEEVYSYYIDNLIGDKLKVTYTNGTNDTDVTYELKEFDVGGEVDQYFVDANGNKLPGDIHYLYYRGDKIEVGKGNSKVYKFKVSYKGRTDSVDITVIGSSDDEIALEKAKDEAESRRWDIDEQYIDDNLNNGAYRPAQIEELERAASALYQALEKATSIDDVNKALAAYENAVKSVKTDAQLKAEEEKARQAAAAKAKAAADAAKAAAAQKAAEQALIAANNGIIDPTLPKVKIKGPKKAKKSFTAQWKKLNKKQQKKVKGIEIEYSLTRDFQNPVFKATSKKKANIKVKKLQSKKTYYVRAHTYVIRNGQRYVSNWSATKKVKVK